MLFSRKLKMENSKILIQIVLLLKHNKINIINKTPTLKMMKLLSGPMKHHLENLPKRIKEIIH